MIDIAQYLGAKVCDAILEDKKGMEMLPVRRSRVRWCGVERPVCQDNERAVRAPHALDSIEYVMERQHLGFFRGNVAQLLGRKTVSPVKSADRVYSKDGYFLVWHVG